MSLRSVNPSTGEPIRSYDEASDAEVESALQAAQQAFLAWRELPFASRAARLRRTAGILEARKYELARLAAIEMGKPVAQGRAEVAKCAWGAAHVADTAEASLAPRPQPTDAGSSHVAFRPLGPILGVMPWNFPFWQVFRFASPALMAGNTVLLKHSSNVPGCAAAIDDLFAEAGFPAGVFRNLLLSSSRVPAIAADPRVRGVSLTGSESAGREMAAVAGRALKKTVLELGGSDPFVVLADADVQQAAAAAVGARTQNSGQSCIAAKRFIVEEAVHDEFVDLLVAGMEALRVGDPLEEASQVGPLARADLVQELHRQVKESAGKGATIRLGGKPLERPGFFYAPTVLTEVCKGMPAADEETFGPVAAVLQARDEAEALLFSNDTRFGLGGSVWTGDLQRGERFASRIEAGAVFVNGIVKSDPRLPFGGVKASGYGRELSRYGLLEFVNVQSVWLR